MKIIKCTPDCITIDHQLFGEHKVYNVNINDIQITETTYGEDKVDLTASLVSTVKSGLLAYIGKNLDKPFSFNNTLSCYYLYKKNFPDTFLVIIDNRLTYCTVKITQEAILVTLNVKYNNYLSDVVSTTEALSPILACDPRYKAQLLEKVKDLLTTVSDLK